MATSIYCARERSIERAKKTLTNKKRCIRRSGATTTRQLRDRLKGHPQEREHSDVLAKAGTARGTECPRRGVHYLLREGSLPEGPRQLGSVTSAKAVE